MKIFGRNQIGMCLDEGIKIKSADILNTEQKALQDLVQRLEEKGIKIRYHNRYEMDKICEGGHHQGVAAEIPEHKYQTVEEILQFAAEKNEPPFVVILDEIVDPHNLGAIIRTAETAGCHGVIISEKRACQVTPTVYKTSSGAALILPIARVTNINRSIEELKAKGLFIYGTSGYATETLWQADLSGPVGIVIGNEGRGLRRLVAENCDSLIKIPMFGKTESLNASTAAAVVIYDIVRRRYG